MLALQSAFGLLVLWVFAWGLSEKRKLIRWRTVFGAIGLQVILAVLLYKFRWFNGITLALSNALNGIQTATAAGTSLLFGYLGGGELPFAVENGKSAMVIAIQTLPVLIVISALTSLLFYWRILPAVVRGFSWVLQRSLGIGGALGLSTAANVFLGPVESPLFVKPYLARLSRGELFAVMVGGMAGIAGTMMVLYGLILSGKVDNAIGHILIASIISAPAAIAFSALLVPHQGELSDGEIDLSLESQSAMDAITRGTVDGVQMLINVIAMVLVLTALIALLNLVLAWMLGAGWTLQALFGMVLAPFAWLIGIPASESSTAGALLGTKTVLNEFLAYRDLTLLPDAALSPRSRVLMTYALCGFANFASLGIMIGGLGTLAPERRSEIIELGYRCLLGGSLATLSCAAVIGVIY